jgi:hypothetical protein
MYSLVQSTCYCGAWFSSHVKAEGLIGGDGRGGERFVLLGSIC